MLYFKAFQDQNETWTKSRHERQQFELTFTILTVKVNTELHAVPPPGLLVNKPSPPNPLFGSSFGP